jgi:hypothetical protein
VEAAVMSRADRVLRSIETGDGGRCVDIFVRADGTFGFEEYRRDIEDGRGWFLIGHYSQGIHASQDAALAAALLKVAWLADVVGTH